MTKCKLCPRVCGADRISGVGYCGQRELPVVGRAAPHMWEEPCISGERGSGTVFFYGCTLGCVYCQNYKISRNGSVGNGSAVTPQELAEVFIGLSQMGVHNINLVTPTMFVPSIAEAVDIAKKGGLTLPIVYNTSGYELVSTLGMMEGRTDIYLPDFKYITPDIAVRYSGVSDYPQYARTSLEYMVKSLGTAEFSEDGMMKRGVIVRHLLLPGQLAEAKRVLEYLFANYGNSIFYSLMCQYTPMPTVKCERFPELTRRVTTYEYDKLIEYALSLGIKNGFTQEREAAAESFIPEFSGL